MGERFHAENVNLNESHDVRPTDEDVGDCPLAPKRRRIEDETKFQRTTTAKVIKQDTDEPDTEVDTEAESTTSILDFDSLSVVFSYLDIRGRVAVGAVCRRWRLVCEGIWKRVKRLDLSQNSFRKFIGYQNDHKIPVFIRLCPNVAEIVVNFIKDDGISTAIAESCPRLERLTVIHLYCSSQKCNLEGLSRIPLECPHLKAFHFKAQHGAFSNSYCTFMNQFVRNVQKLEEITIEGNITDNSNWLALLSKPLKSLHLSKYEFLGRHVLKYVEKHGDRLTSLTLAPSESTLSNKRLRKILSLTPNLNQLNLIGENFELPDEDEDDVSHEIAQLKYLTRLSLASNIIVDTDGFLDNVVKGCSKLSHLDLSYAFDFHSRPPSALLSLVELDNLVSLNLSLVPCLSHVLPGLTACLMRLKELIVIRTNIDDEDFFMIMMHGVALEYLDVSANRNLTNVSLDFACDIIMDYPSRPKLVIRAFWCWRMSNRMADSVVADRIYLDLGDELDDFEDALASSDD